MKKTAVILILFLFVTASSDENVTVDYEQQIGKKEHKMATYWKMQMLFSPIGVCFNSFVLYLFVNERKNLIKSVNFMMW